MLIHLLGSDSIKAKLLLCRWLEHTDDGGGHTMEGKRGPSLQIVDHHLAPGLRWLSKHCLHCSFILGVFLSLFIFFFSFYLSLLCLLFLSRPLSLCRLYLPIWGPEMGNLSQFFLQISQITCLQMENFVVAILYLVYFALKYMYFEDLWVKSCEFPKMRTTYGM